MCSPAGVSGGVCHLFALPAGSPLVRGSMPWLKYRVGTSANNGDWEWKYIASTDQDWVDTYLAEIEEEHNWSEHFRGIEHEVLTTAPRKILDDEIDRTRNKVGWLKSKLKQLEEEQS